MAVKKRVKELAPPIPDKPNKISKKDDLHNEVEALKAQLNSVAHHHRPFEDITSRAVQKYYSEKHIDRMFGNELKTVFPTNAFVITLATMLLFGGIFYLAFSNPEITGSAITGTAKVVGHKAVATSAGLFIVIIILGLALHGVDHHHRHKHDKYKHPKMLE